MRYFGSQSTNFRLPGITIIALTMTLLSISFLVSAKEFIALTKSGARFETTTQPNLPLSEKSMRNSNVTLGNLPLSFTVNQGQAAAGVRFITRGSGYNISFSQREILLSLRKKITRPELVEKLAEPEQFFTDTIRWTLSGANANAEIVGEEELPGRSNYLLGNDPAQWHTAVQMYAKIRYRNIYPGIDLIFYGKQGTLEYDFELAAGANPNKIKFNFAGTTNIALGQQGNLRLQSAHGEMEQLAPTIFQMIDGQRREIKGRYQLHGQHAVSFVVSKYDRRHPLVIDPVLVFASYLGGNNQDQGLGVALDKDGNMYVTGDTFSADFPGMNGVQPILSGATDAYVLKLNATGSAILYATYLGGKGSDTANAITVDDNGNAYITGYTASAVDFPKTGEIPLFGTGGGGEVFVTKLNATGTGLIYSKLIGGNNSDFGLAIAIDATGNAYLAGRTDSTNFPAGGIQADKSGSPIFKSNDQASTWNKANTGLTAPAVQTFTIDPKNSDIIYAGTSIGLFKSTDGGTTWRQPPGAATNLSLIYSVAVNPQATDIVYVGSALGFFKSTNGGETFTVKKSGLPINFPPFIYGITISPANPAIIYAGTYAGVYKSTDSGETWSMASTGIVISGSSIIPTVTKLVIDPINQSILYAGTQYGMYKSTDAGANWVAINNGLNDFVGSNTGPNIQSLTIDPTTPTTLYVGTNARGLYKTINGGVSWQHSDTGLGVTLSGSQLFAPLIPLTILIDPLNPNTLYAGGSLGVFKSTNGGANWQQASNGLTTAYVNSLLIKPGTPSTIFAGTINGADAFVAKINAAGTGMPWATYLGGNEYDEARGIALDANSNVYVAGTTTSNNFPTTVNSFQVNNGGGGDAFITKINSLGTALVYSTYLGGTGGDSGRGVAVSTQGEAYVTGQAGLASFPVLNSIQPFGNDPANSGGSDAFITRFKADGSGLIYSTFLGGAANDFAMAIALDATGNAYITGATQSPDFPVKAAFQPMRERFSQDAFVTKINPTGTTLLASSYLGGTGTETGNALAVDKNGDAVVVGNTGSPDFPTVNSLQSVRSGGDIFVAKLGAAADLAVSQKAAADIVNYGDELTYTMIVTNGGELAATNVKLTDQLPPGAVFVKSTTTQGTCAGTGPVTCTLGNLPSGASVTVTIVIKAPALAMITNSVEVTGTEKEATLTNNSASVTTKVEFTDLALTVIPSVLQIEAGKNISWIFTLRNNGPLDTKSTVITAILPSEVTYVSCQANDKGNCSANGNTVSMTLSAFAFGETASFIVTAKTKDNLTEGTFITTSAKVTGLPTDNIPENNQVTTAIKVIKPDTTPRKNGKIAYITTKSGPSEIVIINPDGTGRFLLLSGSSPAWSPDGTKLAFIDSYGLMLVNADGTGLRQLPLTVAYPSSPSWSPDGTRIAFYGQSPIGLHTIHVDGTNQQQITSSLSFFVRGTLRWSPDGTRFLFGGSGYVNGGVATIYADGSGFKGLTQAPDSRIGDVNPAWSPDGTKIVFSRNSFSSANIFVMNADGSNVKQLTNGNYQDDTPTFSPDGTQIAFTRNTNLMVMQADGTGLRELWKENSLYPLSHVDWQRVPTTPLPKTYVISGRIVNTGVRFATPKIELTGTRTAVTTIESDGTFSFGNLPEGGNYTITVSDPSFRLTPATRTWTNLQADQSNFDIVATFEGRTISGKIVDSGGVPIVGARVWLYGTFGLNLYTNTDANGRYSFTDLYSGFDYTVYPLGYASNDVYQPQTISFLALRENQTADFKGTREKLTLTAKVVDSAGAGVSGVKVTLNGINGVINNSVDATTDSSGNVMLTDLLSGYLYTVTAAKSGLKIEPASRTLVFNKNWNLNFYSGVSSVATVSAANYSAQPITPAGIVALFGSGLALAPKLPEGGLVYTLDGVSVQMEGLDGIIYNCFLFYVSPTQINFLVPSEISSGEAMITIYRNDKVVGAGKVQVAAVSPGLFTTNQDGTGPASAAVLRVKAGNLQTYEDSFIYDAIAKKYVTRPIDLGADLGNQTDQVFLELYGTGIRKRTSLVNVAAKIGGIAAEVLYADAQGFYAGLDQINVRIPRTLIGRGEVDLELTVDGKPANPVKINIK